MPEQKYTLETITREQLARLQERLNSQFRESGAKGCIGGEVRVDLPSGNDFQMFPRQWFESAGPIRVMG